MTERERERESMRESKVGESKNQSSILKRETLFYFPPNRSYISTKMDDVTWQTAKILICLPFLKFGSVSSKVDR